MNSNKISSHRTVTERKPEPAMVYRVKVAKAEDTTCYGKAKEFFIF